MSQMAFSCADCLRSEIPFRVSSRIAIDCNTANGASNDVCVVDVKHASHSSGFLENLRVRNYRLLDYASRIDSPAGVIRIPLVQLVREAICFLGIAGLAKCERGLVESARSDGWVVVKQSDAFECFAGVIEVSTLQLHFACKQARFGIYAALGLQRHDFFGDLLCLVRFMGAYLNHAERE